MAYNPSEAQPATPVVSNFSPHCSVDFGTSERFGCIPGWGEQIMLTAREYPEIFPGFIRCGGCLQAP
jgi:hypothetical protein